MEVACERAVCCTHARGFFIGIEARAGYCKGEFVSGPEMEDVVI